MKAYWFSSLGGTTQNQKTAAAIGRTDTVDGEIVPCEHGLHGSPTPFDALQYAQGSILWEVELAGTVMPHGAPLDKYAASERTYLRQVDISQLLRVFACRQALGFIHLWDAPAVVREYLESVVGGAERTDIRAAAWAAAWDVARAAAWDAARAAAGDAAWDAARAAAKTQFNEMALAALATCKTEGSI